MIEAKNVSVHFKRGIFKKKITALKNFSIRVEGDVFGLLGPNGAGKSTAMYCLLGLIKPDEGDVHINGKIPRIGDKLFEKIAYLPEEPHYHLYLTVKEAMKYYASLYLEDVSDSKVDEILEFLELEKFADLKLEKCSKGMKQKMGLGLCMLKNAEIVFLDEPTRGLDPLMVRKIRDVIFEMNRRGTTVFLNSHILSEVEMLCNRIAIMDRGRVIVQDDLKKLVRFDEEKYVVEVEEIKSLPDYATVIEKKRNVFFCEIPYNRLVDFIKLAQNKGVKIYECSIKKMSLEKAFLEILKEKADA